MKRIIKIEIYWILLTLIVSLLLPIFVSGHDKYLSIYLWIQFSFFINATFLIIYTIINITLKIIKK